MMTWKDQIPAAVTGSYWPFGLRYERTLRRSWCASGWVSSLLLCPLSVSHWEPRPTTSIWFTCKKNLYTFLQCVTDACSPRSHCWDWILQIRWCTSAIIWHLTYIFIHKVQFMSKATLKFHCCWWRQNLESLFECISAQKCVHTKKGGEKSVLFFAPSVNTTLVM